MEELFREAADVGGGYFAITLAHYDSETGLLLLEQQATGPGETGGLQPLTVPQPRQIQDTVPGRSQALRYAIIQADHWIGIVRGSLASA